MHQNIQSIKGKELEIELFLNTFNINILCITEHWLKQHELMFNFSAHQVGSSFIRLNSIHGGSLILLSKYLQYKERQDIVSLSVERTIEIASVELEQFIVVCVYRPPLSLFENFEKVMDEALFKLSNTNKNIIVCGDFNINILENNTLTSRLLSLFQSHNLNNLFMEPTRITKTSATCIDNVFTNIKISNKIIINKLGSDHCGQLITFKNFKFRPNKYKIMCVPVTAARLNEMKIELLKNLPFLINSCPNVMYNAFFETFLKVFNTIFKPKSMYVSNALMFSEWATEELHKRKQILYELYDQRQFNTSDGFKDYVKQFSKSFKIDCKLAKSRYISSKIKSSSNIIKATWKIINEEMEEKNLKILTILNLL